MLEHFASKRDASGSYLVECNALVPGHVSVPHPLDRSVLRGIGPRTAPRLLQVRYVDETVLSDVEGHEGVPQHAELRLLRLSLALHKHRDLLHELLGYHATHSPHRVVLFSPAPAAPRTACALLRFLRSAAKSVASVGPGAGGRGPHALTQRRRVAGVEARPLGVLEFRTCRELRVAVEVK